LFGHGSQGITLAVAENVRMTPLQFVGNAGNHIAQFKCAALFVEGGVEDNL